MTWKSTTLMNYKTAIQCCTWAGVNRNAFDTMVSDLHFVNVEQRIGNMNKGNPHRTIIRDLDGSLTGLNKYVEVVGRSPIREADEKCQHIKELGKSAMACERVHRRVILGHSILAQEDHVL